VKEEGRQGGRQRKRDTERDRQCKQEGCISSDYLAGRVSAESHLPDTGPEHLGGSLQSVPPSVLRERASQEH